MKKSEYWHPDRANPISVDELKRADPEFQKEVMKQWFLSNFENPVENTPYDEGYVYIWGGPYDAAEELEDEFGEIVESKLIEDCAVELEEQESCQDWAAIPHESDYDESLLEVIGQNQDFFQTFLGSISNIKSLLDLDLGELLNQNLYRLLFVNVISTLETYLADAFLNTVLPNDTLLRNFVEKNPDFHKRSLTLDRIFARMDALRDEVKGYLLDIRYHNLAKVGEMYKAALEVEFLPTSGGLFRAIDQRHDFVHRNGKTKDGKVRALKKEDVVALVNEVESFVKHINDQLTTKAAS